ncbi:cation diffusion facilitator family transporter [Paenibacillus larvae]
MTDVRFSKADFAAWMGVIGNVGLAALKGVVGFMSGSLALVADAVHSAADVAGSVAVLKISRSARMPKEDANSRYSQKAAIIVHVLFSVMLMIVGLELSLLAIKTIARGVQAPPGRMALVVIVLSIVLKEALFRYRFRTGTQPVAGSIWSSTWSYRSDVYSSLTAFAGIGVSLLGEMYNKSWLYMLDPMAGLIVALFIIHMGFRLIIELIHNTIDQMMQQEDTEVFIEVVHQTKGVITVDDLKTREQGHYVILEVKISVNPKISVLEGHDIAQHVKKQVMRKFSHVSDVIVQVNPYDVGFPYRQQDVKSSVDDYPTLLH